MLFLNIICLLLGGLLNEQEVLDNPFTLGPLFGFFLRLRPCLGQASRQHDVLQLHEGDDL